MKIPEYENRVLPTTSPGGVFSLPGEKIPYRNRPYILSPEMRVSAAVIDVARDINEKIQESERLAAFNKGERESLSDWIETKRAFIEDPYYANMETGELMEEFRMARAQSKSRILGGTKSYIVRDKLATSIDKNDVGYGLQVRALGWERHINRERGAIAEDGIRLGDEAIQTGNMQPLVKFRSILAGAVAANIYNEKEAGVLLRDNARRTGFGYGKKVILESDGDAEERLTGHPLVTNMEDPDEYTLLLSAQHADERNRNEKKKVSHAELARLRKDQDDAYTHRVIHGTGGEDIPGRIIKLFKDPDRREAELADWEERVKRADVLHISNQKLANGTLAENYSFLLSNDPIKKKTSEDAVIASVGYAHFVSGLARKEKDLKEDPKAWVIRNNPDKANDINFIMSEQKRVGGPNQKVRLLTTAEAKSMASKIMSAPAGDILNIVKDIEEKNNKEHIEPIWEELAKFGKLPIGFQLIKFADTDEEKLTIASAIKTKPAELKEALGGTRESDLQTMRNNIDTIFRKTYDKTFKPTPNNVEQNNNLKTAILNIAMYNHINKGMAVGNSAAYAARLVTDKYVYKDKLRIPEEFDADVITGTLGFIQQNILSANTVSTRYDANGIKRIKEKGYWMTNDTDDGAVLLDEDGSPVLWVNNKKINLPFAEIQNIRDAMIVRKVKIDQNVMGVIAAQESEVGMTEEELRKTNALIELFTNLGK